MTPPTTPRQTCFRRSELTRFWGRGHPDGTFDYYGPAISEYGQLLTVAARYVRITGDTAWLRENLPPLQHILHSLLAQILEAGQVRHYLLGFYGHLAHHQTPGSFTAYESVTIRGDSKRDYASDYCVPAQLVEPQLLRWMVAWEPWAKPELWLARAIPSEWYARGFAARRIPSCWGLVNLRVTPSAKGLEAQVEMESAHPDLKVNVRLRPPFAVNASNITVSGTKRWKWNARQVAVELWGPWKQVIISMGN